MEIRQLFATNLRRLRKEYEERTGEKLSQEALAAEAGIDRAHVSKIEREIVYVGLEIVEKIAKVLEVEPMEFFRPPEKKTRTKK